jgi:hypothetical protein
MKITLNKVTELNEQFALLTTARLKASKALEVYKFKKKIEELGAFFEEKRLAICNTYGELIENGTKFSFKNEDVEKVNSEFADLFATEEELPDFSITQAELDASEIKVTAKFFAVLTDFIKE